VIVDTQIATDDLRVVLGSRRYAVVSPWNRVPLGHISQLAVDRAGRVYVFQRTGSPIVVLGPEGDLVDSETTSLTPRRPRRASLRRKSVQKVSASDAPIAKPSTSRLPSSLTPTATITVTETMRPSRRAFT
jgi:hypothetical protein